MRSQRNADVARQADGPKRGAQRRGQQGSLGEGNGAGLFFLYTLFADIVSKLAWVCWTVSARLQTILELSSKPAVTALVSGKILEFSHLFLQFALYMFFHIFAFFLHLYFFYFNTHYEYLLM